MEHGFNLDHLIKFQDTRILSTLLIYVVQLIREVIDFEFHLNIMNREDVLTSSGVWKPLI